MAKKVAPEETTSESMPTTDSATSTPADAPPAPRKNRPKNKTVAFNNAMEALGKDAKPLRIQEWIKEHYGWTLKTTLLSTYKGNWVRKHGKGGGGPVRKASGPAKEGGKDATLSDIRELKAMIARVGVAQFKEMLGLLGVK